LLKRDCRTAQAITGVIIRKLPLHTAATMSQRGMSSAALSKTEIEDLQKTAIEAATLTGMVTATKEGSTQTDSGAARLELLVGRPQSRLLARPAFFMPKTLADARGSVSPKRGGIHARSPGRLRGACAPARGGNPGVPGQSRAGREPPHVLPPPEPGAPPA
jgi:hypothetical protein